jgi:hypothetical protein
MGGLEAMPGGYGGRPFRAPVVVWHGCRRRCEHAFVSIKGSDYRCLKQALDRGDLPLVKASAAQLPSVDLPTALDIALLVMEQEPQNGERAAVRWLGRLCVERRDVTLAQVREALDALTLLVEEPEAAEARLRRLAGSVT